MRYYLIAGERSGDLHGSNLIKSLKKKDGKAEFRCWGGSYMEKAGAELVVHYRNLAFMGFVEVLIYFRKILRYLKKCRQDILLFKPDVVILIDFGGFNLRIARFLKNTEISIYYYISPKVWAWNTRRALKIKALVDRMFVILPFEKEFYGQYGMKVDYVGNPVVDAVREHEPESSFLNDTGIEKHEYVAFLPGSRNQELKSILPAMVRLAADMRKVKFILAAIDTVDQDIYRICAGVPNIQIIYNRTYDILAYAKAGVITSGTATLETALWEVPQVVVYRFVSKLSFLIARMVIKVKFISLVNLIAGREVVKEFIQGNLTHENLRSELRSLLDDSKKRNRILNDYHEIKLILGEDPVSDKVAELIFRYLQN